MYQLTIEVTPAYLHAKGSGERTQANMERFLEESYAACVKHGRSSLLLEVQFSGSNLSLSDIFEVISRRAEDGAKLHRIAYVDASSADAHFTETAAINRGVNARLCPDVATAVQWLQG